jgi:hypothetical protein
VDGIHLPDSKPTVLPSLSKLVEEMERESLANAEEAIAEIVLGQLQEIWGARINFEKLVEATNRLARQSLIRGGEQNGESVCRQEELADGGTRGPSYRPSTPRLE